MAMLVSLMPAAIVHSSTANASDKPKSVSVPDFEKRLKRITEGASQSGINVEVIRPNREFNHLSTGFPLTGAHGIVECATCHVGGVFRGTPRSCSGCHAKGRRVAATSMPPNHLITSEPCELCHVNTVTFTGAKYNHGKAYPGSCANCHNSVMATGKPASHSSGIKTVESCDKCHRTYAWLPTMYDHARVAPGSCSTCHNVNPYPTGKPSNHASAGRATYACDSCHNYLAWSPAAYKHVGALICASCHNYTTGINFTPTKPDHIPTITGCEACHKSYTTWTGASGHIGNEAGRCLECHLAKRPSSHTAAAYLVSCDACHSTTSWAFNHAAQQGKHTCASCHLALAARRHGTPTVGSRYYNCDDSGCHTVNSWDK